jgi:g-D-glutamyl-meso-diaminopimelate peptidase
MRSNIALIFLFFSMFFGPMKLEAQIVNPHQVYTYEQMEKDLQHLQQMYPHLSLHTIGKSHFGRKIWAVKLGKGKENIMLIGAHHGREWLTTSLLMMMLEKYAHAYQNKGEVGGFSSEVFDDVAIWFVPMLNPDGVTIQQKGFAAIPSEMHDEYFEMNGYSPDFSKWKANGIGIDLNRQYPAGWEKVNTMPIPWYQFYKGESPQAAEEVKAIVSLTGNIKPLAAVSYHSSGREIFWKYKNGKHVKRDEKVAKKVSRLTGYKLSVPERNARGAGFTDWFISAWQRVGLTIEICPLVEEASPPLSVFQEEWKRNQSVGIMLAKEAKRLK